MTLPDPGVTTPPTDEQQTYEVRFTTMIEVSVTLEAVDEEDASDRAWARAEAWADTVHGDFQGVRAFVTLDGIGADSVEVTE